VGLETNRYAGTISGVIGLFAQIGASCSGNIVGAMVSKSGWKYYVPSQIAGTISLVLLLLVAHFLGTPRQHRSKHD
jgi:sugar phosphate permease